MSAAAQYGALSRRSIVNTARQPAAIVPALTFPLLFLALTSAALNRAIMLPGFPPVESFLQFAVATTIVQGALFGAVAAGSDMATDIAGGFFDRLIASPVARTSILVGRLAGAATLGFVQALLYLGVGTLFGLTIDGGPAAVLAIAVVAAVVSAGIGGLAVAFGLRTGSSEAVQGAFPLLFVLMFFSSAFFPRNLMEGWFKIVATANPLSRLIEGLREQVIAGLDLPELLAAASVAAAIFVVGVTASALALRGRLAAGGG
ncbi:MAG: ABC transporter permease [Actinomycetota bacterium]|nr:ABC transporter permease [Actinomycetota bacterium]